MKGVLLAGGTGSRLMPMTAVVNKHLLPVADKPMVFHPLKTLSLLGCTDVLLVTGGEGSGEFMRLVGGGEQFGFSSAYYTYQHGSGGIAKALSLARGFTGNESFVCILGDNVFPVGEQVKKLAAGWKADSSGARVVLHPCDDPRRYAVPFMADERITTIVEKPESPQSKYAVIGLYFFDSTVYDYIDSLVPSQRQEYEITDVNNRYARERRLSHVFYCGQWVDAGTKESLQAAARIFNDAHHTLPPEIIYRSDGGDDGEEAATTITLTS